MEECQNQAVPERTDSFQIVIFLFSILISVQVLCHKLFLRAFRNKCVTVADLPLCQC